MKVSITQRIKTLLFTSAPRWWSPFELEQSLQARSVPRRLREIIAEDKTWTGRGETPKHLRLYASRWVENAADGRHKQYQYKGTTKAPVLFC